MTMDPLILARTTYILGWLNILGLILVLLSCRCIIGLKPTVFGKSKFYMKFYSYHCYYWWFFIASVLAHAILAITTFGNQF